MNYLTRNKIYEKTAPNKDAKKVYIICEGQNTEYSYFNYFKGFSSNIDLILIRSRNGQTDPLKLKEQAILLFLGNKEEDITPKFTLSNEYKDEVWFVIDTDRWNEGNKIEQLKEFCKLQNNKIGDWSVAQSNPCFELWQYYHFNENKPNIKKVINCASFKHFVSQSIKGGFDNRTMPIEIEAAITNSVTNYSEEKNCQPSLYSTQVHELGKVIYQFIKNELNNAINNNK